jgi:hypothetical protein
VPNPQIAEQLSSHAIERFLTGEIAAEHRHPEDREAEPTDLHPQAMPLHA